MDIVPYEPAGGLIKYNPGNTSIVPTTGVFGNAMPEVYKVQEISKLPEVIENKPVETEKLPDEIKSNEVNREIKIFRAGEVLKKGLDDYYNALKNGEIEIIDPTKEKQYKINKVSGALDIDVPNVNNMNIGYNGAMGKYNPSVDSNFVVKLPEDIVKLNKKARQNYEKKSYAQNALDSLYENKFIDDFYVKHSDYYESVGVTKDSIIVEMEKFRG